MTSLTEKTLPQLNAGVSVPRYDRRHVSTGIVHLGVGNFHRSHQAMYIDTLMNSGAAMDWGICGIGLQPSSTRMRAAMAAQDGTTDPLFARFLLEYMTQEAIPSLRPVPGIDLQHYARELIERFSRFTRVYTSILASMRVHGVRRTLADLDRYATSSMADREPAGLERKSP
jgi:mannitol-1-phosphate/altronate dehydrogenase